MAMVDDEKVLAALKDAWEAATAIEPVAGGVTLDEVEQLAKKLAAVSGLIEAGLAEITDEEERTGVEGTLARIYARCAAVSIAAGDMARSDRWLAEAERHAHDEDELAELAAARKAQERYRTLVHGRNLIANHREAEARKLWRSLAGGDDAIARAARIEEKAPRPLGDRALPTLYRWNGIGLGFYGRRDHWPDGSYATTHCFSLVYVPLIPVGAYRVRDAVDGYMIMARERLSTFAKVARIAVVAGIVALIAGFAIHTYLNDPTRVANQRFERALDTEGKTPEAALAALDEALGDVYRVDPARVERAGAAVVELSAGYVGKPFTADRIDQASKVVRRYEGLTRRRARASRATRS
ncbi:MAG: hypothetical protein KF773_17020 [Deltaproteobacteria bacterium]|nr:hypothetical protein [Deltaproteobacteria bacterium]